MHAACRAVRNRGRFRALETMRLQSGSSGSGTPILSPFARSVFGYAVAGEQGTCLPTIGQLVDRAALVVEVEG